MATPAHRPPSRCIPTVFTFSAAISACEKCGGRADEALAIFGKMAPAGVLPNAVAYNAPASNPSPEPLSPSP